MSESMKVEQKMARSIETWRKCDPVLMASQSQAALTFAFRDMKRDILVLADEVEWLTSANIIAEGLAKQNKEMAENFIALKQERDELRRRVAELESQLEDAHYEIIEAGERRSE